MNKNKNESGQSLFESVIAISVVGVALISLVGLTISAIGSATLAKNQTLATKYTKEALEWLRGERDRNWNQFLSRSTAGGSRYCINILPTGNWNTGTCGSSEN